MRFGEHTIKTRRLRPAPAAGPSGSAYNCAQDPGRAVFLFLFLPFCSLCSRSSSGTFLRPLVFRLKPLFPFFVDLSPFVCYDVPGAKE